MKKIILASASPRRQDLLRQLGVPFEVCISNTRETINPTEPPGDLVKRLSGEKADNVLLRAHGPAFILAADTVVVIQREILGKPKDRDGAFQILRKLQGGRHTVYTGVTLVDLENDPVRRKNFVEKTDVFMHAMRDEEIWDYIYTCEPFDKAGAYAIQGKGSFLVERIEGDYYTVMGLPLARIAQALKIWGADLMKAGTALS
ncbi:MAG: Maf family protein [Clostridiales bacterium]|jgi:septum formation protein|nr:Maf family protein [Clostridiales bacterium]